MREQKDGKNLSLSVTWEPHQGVPYFVVLLLCLGVWRGLLWGGTEYGSKEERSGVIHIFGIAKRMATVEAEILGM